MQVTIKNCTVKSQTKLPLKIQMNQKIQKEKQKDWKNKAKLCDHKFQAPRPWEYGLING